MTTKTTWQNRIVGHGEERPDQLLANPRNWRIHPKAQQDALGGLLDKVGWVQDVIVNQRTGHVVDGHLRVSLAISREEPAIPVVYVDLSVEEEALVLASYDPLSAMAVTDEEILAGLLGDVSAEGALADMLGSLIKGGPKEGLTDPDDVPEAPEPVTHLGDLWLLGEHRLLCGDATKTEDVGRLLDGVDPVVLWTDPPYGIDYEDLRGRHEAIVNDANPSIAGAAITRALAAMATQSTFVCCNWQSYETIRSSVEETGRPVKAVIVWDKERGVQNLDRFFKQHEWIIYSGPFGGERTIDGDVWRIARDVRADHPTAKPVELIERSLNATTGDVYDPFLGSGTTLIAAERLGRRCYAMEIEPKYVDVAVRRWENFTGQKAVLDGH